MAIKTETIPQLFNLALATGVIVTVGDAVQDLIQGYDAGRVAARKAAVLAAMLGYVLLWSTKIFVDDNEVLFGGKSRKRPGVDLVFLVVSYSFLISAAAALTSAYFLFLLMGHFVTLILWVAVSYLFDKTEEDATTPNASRDYRRTWLVIDLLSLLTLIAISLNQDSILWWWLGTVTLLALLSIDAWRSETLSSRKLMGPKDETADHAAVGGSA